MFIDRQNKMHTGARLYKIPLLENKATCKVMNLIKLAHRHIKGIPLGEDIRSGVSRVARDPARCVIHAGDFGLKYQGFVHCRYESVVVEWIVQWGVEW